MPTNKLTGSLLDDVTIIGSDNDALSGAQLIAPDHSPRAPYGAATAPVRYASGEAASLQWQVEQFLFHQAELLDRKLWQSFIDLFAEDGVYWMPATPDQTEWVDSPSIFAEDRELMQVRMGRVTHPKAWSQAGSWETNHVVGNVVIEAMSDSTIVVRSRFQMLELRRDIMRHFGGTYRHTLLREDGNFRIAVQRVDLINAQALWEYVLQIWV